MQKFPTFLTYITKTEIVSNRDYGLLQATYYPNIDCNSPRGKE